MALQQYDAWKIMLSAKAGFTGEELRLLMLAVMSGMRDAGIDEATVWNVMGAADAAVFGNRLGFARSDKKQWGERSAGSTGKGDSEIVEVEVVEPSENGHTSESGQEKQS